MHQFWCQDQKIQILNNIIDARDSFLHAHDSYQDNKGVPMILSKYEIT